MERTTALLVAGGGAAGLLASITAARRNCPVVLLEKNEQLGKKLLLTGQGRCNLTNATSIEGLVENIQGSGRFLYSCFQRFDSEQTRKFFEKLGVPLKVERGGRVFPVSDSAKDVVTALTGEIASLPVKVHCKAKVERILTEGNRVKAVRTSDGRVFQADSIILTTGGASYPHTGSSGDGYRIAQELGHQVVPLFPSLVPLETEEEWVTRLSGLGLRNVRASVLADGKKADSLFGELLFTHFGISGPLTLTLSRQVVVLLADKRRVQVSIDLKPALSPEVLLDRINRDFLKFKNKYFSNALDDLLPQLLIPVVVELSGISPSKKVSQITKEERIHLGRLLKDFTVTVKKARPLSEAIVTAGGVSTNEINPATMASKLYPNLYWAGEVVDVDGLTGGFNLQAAFAMGYTAGLSAAGVSSW